MTAPDQGLTMAARLTAHSPVDLDTAIWGAKNTDQIGGELGRRPGAPKNLVSPICWPAKDPDTLHMGIRVTSKIKDPLELATALIAMATERGITPVIFSHIDRTALEQFGLRIEHVTGPDPQARHDCEKELMQYFQMAIVMDARDLVSFR